VVEDAAPDFVLLLDDELFEEEEAPGALVPDELVASLRR